MSNGEAVEIVDVKEYAAFIRWGAIPALFVGPPPVVGEEVVLVCVEASDDGVGLNFKVKNKK